MISNGYQPKKQQGERPNSPGFKEKKIKLLERHDPGKAFHDPVQNPSHYVGDYGLETIEVIENFAATNAHRSHSIKYLLRAGRKGDRAKRRQDLEKCRQWIAMELKFLGADADDH